MSANDRPPILRVISRETGAQRVWGCDHADRRTWGDLIAETVLRHRAILYTDEGPRQQRRHAPHATGCHRTQAGAREEVHEGIRAGPCNTGASSGGRASHLPTCLPRGSHAGLAARGGHL
jgi:hypothetical protein